MSMWFLGSGNSHSKDLGNSCACLYINNEPSLLIDLGSEAFFSAKTWFQDRFPAIFVTHNHLDHIGGFERLFYAHAFQVEEKGLIKLYIPSALIPKMHRMLASHGSALGEGGLNFWDVFQVIPVEDFFYHQGLRFETFAVRHQYSGEAYGLSLPGHFLYSGDTRPIDDLFSRYASHNELIFHDAGLTANPAHSGVDELDKIYQFHNVKNRCVLYHLDCEQSIQKAEDQGWQVARPGNEYVIRK